MILPLSSTHSNLTKVHQGKSYGLNVIFGIVKLFRSTLGKTILFQHRLKIFELDGREIFSFLIRSRQVFNEVMQKKSNLNFS